MNKIMLAKPFLMVAVLGAAAVACGASDGGSGSHGSVGTGPKATTQQKSLSPAERFIALNAKTNSELNLVTLKYLNNGTEVAMFYEPSPGNVMFSIAGSPVGHSVLNRTLIQGKTPSQLWDLVAPGESVPEALAHAIWRSKNPAPVAENAQPERTQVSAPAHAQPEGRRVSAPPPAVPSKGEQLLSGGYCSNGGFWNDWNALASGSANQDVGVSNWGILEDNWDYTGHERFAACPTGDVSNKGGELWVNWRDGSQSSWHLEPDFYQISPFGLPNYNCGWDACCGHGFQIGGTRCTPVTTHANGGFTSQCFFDQGFSCGDDFDWIGFVTDNGPSYCQDGQASCPCRTPDCDGNCGSGPFCW
jgi:hypothetical protein